MFQTRPWFGGGSRHKVVVGGASVESEVLPVDLGPTGPVRPCAPRAGVASGRPQRSWRLRAGHAGAAALVAAAGWSHVGALAQSQQGAPATETATSDCAVGALRMDAAALERIARKFPSAVGGCSLAPSGPAERVAPAPWRGPVERIDPPAGSSLPGAVLLPDGSGTRSAPAEAPGSPNAPRTELSPRGSGVAATGAESPGARIDASARGRMQTLDPEVDAVARRHQIDPLLLHALIHVESRHRPEAVSVAGARGLMQLMPQTAARFGVVSPSQLHATPDNLNAGAAYLKTLQAEFGNDLERVLAAYNAGEGAVRRYDGVPPYAETRAYVRDVLAVYERLRAERAAAVRS